MKRPPIFPDVTVAIPHGTPWHAVIVKVRRAIRNEHRAVTRENLDAFSDEVLEGEFTDSREIAARWVVIEE